MKKVLFTIIIVIAFSFAYLYQSPILSKEEAINSALNHLKNPPKEWSVSISTIDLDEIQPDNFHMELNQKPGFWNELTNRQKWDILIKTDQIELTIWIDAYSGSLIEIIGRLN